MSVIKALMGVQGATQYVDDVFSTYLYTGNGSTQTITNGIDLAGKGGLVWTKNRTGANDHLLFDSQRNNYGLYSNLTNAQANYATEAPVFSPTGYSITSNNFSLNNSGGSTYVSWTFRKAAKFFDCGTLTSDVSGNATFNHSLGGSPGMVILKRTDSASSWYVWHRSLTSTNYSIQLQSTAAQADNGFAWITPSASSVSINGGFLGASLPWVWYAFAHDTASDGLIQCGSFTTDGSGNATVTLGWEPQFLIEKASSASGSWWLMDVMRGFTVGGSVNNLAANSSSAEGTNSSYVPTATGFTVGSHATSTTYIYLAIRRPNKPPTSGTQVYNAIARTGTNTNSVITGVGFAPDVVIPKRRTSPANNSWFDRLRGVYNYLIAHSTNPEANETTTLTKFDVMDGFGVGIDNALVANTGDEIYWNFRRVPGFMDVVCYTGTSSSTTVTHNLGVVPEMIVVKHRITSVDWAVYHSAVGNTAALALNTTAGPATSINYWNNTSPTATNFSVGAATATNGNSGGLVAYLFATLPGISKVGSYTGNGGTADSAGTSQTINCGFSAGARFVMIKCTSNASDWLVWDSVRGIVAGNDPHLSLNTTVAEVTTDDAIDPDNSGFIVNQLAVSGGLPTSGNLNVTGRTYIFLAIA